jgi:hypothetical protein
VLKVHYDDWHFVGHLKVQVQGHLRRVLTECVKVAQLSISTPVESKSCHEALRGGAWMDLKVLRIVVPALGSGLSCVEDETVRMLRGGCPNLERLEVLDAGVASFGRVSTQKAVLFEMEFTVHELINIDAGAIKSIAYLQLNLALILCLWNMYRNSSCRHSRPFFVPLSPPHHLHLISLPETVYSTSNISL